MSHFVLSDCNNFYASCERLFNPKLEGRPVVVLSNNDGCIIARSQEAKALGIHMGDPFFKVRGFCQQNGVAIFSSNYQLYGDLSQRVMEIYIQSVPEVELYSIDEAFLKFPATLLDQEVILECQNLRKKVKMWTSLPISLGIGPTKTIAKLANSLAKKTSTGVFSLNCLKMRQKAYANLDVGEVWGIGSQLKSKLHLLGIFTIEQFVNTDPYFIRKKFGVTVERTLWELKGICCLPLEETSPKKNITCSRSFGKVVTEFSELCEAVATFVSTACLKVRKQGSYAQAVCVYTEVYVTANREMCRYSSYAAPLMTPSADTREIITVAKQCLLRQFNKGARYKKCGVVLLDLIAKNKIVPTFFDKPSNPKRSQLMQCVDDVNARFGKNTLFFCAMGTNPQWKGLSKQRSRHYTTSWNDLAIAIA